jgi:hypothetical protein
VRVAFPTIRIPSCCGPTIGESFFAILLSGTEKPCMPSSAFSSLSYPLSKEDTPYLKSLRNTEGFERLGDQSMDVTSAELILLLFLRETAKRRTVITFEALRCVKPTSLFISAAVAAEF